ncbi:hypothetical protein M5C95_12040 [Acidovorax sp. NCPPB 4044]|nr:hypothetical protein [Acidovorax sp. NCPPB 4044]MDA8521487.1 hypothetical protein [Acidovorax sp. NCPPB 4044]
MKVLPRPGPALRAAMSPAVQLREALRQGQAHAQPGLGARVAAVHLREHPEDALQPPRGDADARVAHLGMGARGVLPAAQGDVPARLGVAGRVVQQVGEHLHEAHAIPFDGDGGGRLVHVEAMAPLVDAGPGEFDGLGGDVPQVERLARQLDVVAADARDVQQLVHQPHHVPDLAAEHLGRACLRRLSHRVEQQLGRAADGCQRIAQLVGQRGEEFVLAADHLLQAPFAVLQRRLGAAARRDVGEQDADTAGHGGVGGKGEDVEAAVAELFRELLEADGLAPGGHAAVAFEPSTVEVGDQLAHRFAGRVDESGVPPESRVHFQEAVVGGPARGVEDHLDDAKAFVDGVEQLPVADIRGAWRPAARRASALPCASPCGVPVPTEWGVASGAGEGGCMSGGIRVGLRVRLPAGSACRPALLRAVLAVCGQTECLPFLPEGPRPHRQNLRQRCAAADKLGPVAAHGRRPVRGRRHRFSA